MRSTVPWMLIVLASKLIEESQSKRHQLNDLASEAGQNVHDVNQVPSAASADAWTIPRIGPTVTALMRRACFRFLLPRLAISRTGFPSTASWRTIRRKCLTLT